MDEDRNDAATPAATTESGGRRSLEHIKLLADVPTDRIRTLETQVTWRTFAPNEMIFEIDDTSTDVYFIARGKLRIIIFSHHEGDTVPEGPAGGNEGSVILADMTTGDTFGEIAAVDGRPRSARAVALDNCHIACLPADAFVQLIEDCPKVAVALVRRFAGLVRSLNRRVHSLSTQSPTQRVYSELVRLSEPNTQGDGSWLIPTLPAHGDIASWAGTEKETVAQAIGQLARDGIVERRHRTLLVKNHARLRFLAHL